jgi:hypothetical protein
MAIDPSIIAGLKPPQFETPTNALMQLLQVQHAQSQSQMDDLAYGEKQREVQQNMLLNNVYKSATGADGTVDRNKLYSGIADAGLGAKLPGVQKSYQDLDKDQSITNQNNANAKKIDYDTLTHQFEMAGQLASAWAKDPGVSQQQIRNGLAAAAHSKIITPEIYQQKLGELDGVPDDPKLLNQWATSTLQQVMKSKDSMPFIKPSANTVATNERIEREGAANRAKDIQVQKMIGARQDAGDAANSTFTPEAIANAAARYNFDGTLPPMGMGKAGSAGRAAILNEAARQKAGVDPSQQRADQLGNKNDVAARGAAVKSFATGKDGQAVQSANTALNHLDTIRQLAEAQKSGDIQAFNRAARALGSQLGQSAPTNLNAALIMVAPEVSKAVVGSGGTGHERDQAIQALNPNGSPDQIIGATQTMQELFGGRLTEAQRTYERSTGKQDFRATMLSPAAQRVLDKAHGGGAPNPAALPAKNSKGWTLMVDAHGNRAYVSPDKSQHEEVR